VGFVAGHATSSANRGDHFRSSASGQGGGMMGGQDPRGIDPDGDNWTGGQGINPNAPQNTTPQPGQITPSG